MTQAHLEGSNSQEPVRIAKPYNDEHIENRVISILRLGRLVQGKIVEEFEQSLCKYLGTKYAICVNSGTAALHASILALKMVHQDRGEVLTTPLSFAATANAIIHAGCTPVFSDVDAETFNIDPSGIEDKINDRTLAIEPVDVYGLPADLEQIGKIAGSHGIHVVEDAAESIGATYKGKRIGSISTLSCFSTYATKNLHTAEGGVITTNDDHFSSTIRMIRNQGQSSRYNQKILGYNFRMIEICAAIGLGQLPLLDELNERRRQNAIYLKERLSKVDSIGFQKVDDPSAHSWYLFSLTLDGKRAGMSRDSFVSKLKESGIEADVAWPTPIHLQPYFQETFGFKRGQFPVAEGICEKVFQLPVQPFLTRDELDRIILSVRQILV
jgi:perosamine synthetase